jgi:hypothetical protein
MIRSRKGVVLFIYVRMSDGPSPSFPLSLCTPCSSSSLTVAHQTASHSKMAMPRYRYAIGQAPVRFPSPAPSIQDDEETEDTAVNASLKPDKETKRTSRWRTASTVDDTSVPSKRDEETRARLMDDRRRTKSMCDGPDVNFLAPVLKPLLMSPSASSSRLSVKSTNRPGQGSKQRYADEKTALKGKTGDMTQRPQRPASASVSSSIRPSSLFWTDYDAERSETGASKQGQQLKAKRSYGAMDSSGLPKEEEDPNDPYGYRFLAGPALLPSFHEEQQTKQKLKEVKSRTCGPRIEMIKKNRWVATTIVGLIITTGGMWYLFF